MGSYATPCRANIALIELRGDGVVAGRTGPHDLIDNRSHIGSKPPRIAVFFRLVAKISRSVYPCLYTCGQPPAGIARVSDSSIFRSSIFSRLQRPKVRNPATAIVVVITNPMIVRSCVQPNVHGLMSRDGGCGAYAERDGSRLQQPRHLDSGPLAAARRGNAALLQARRDRPQ
jgi:hypothetical protein